MKILHILDHSIPLHSGYTFRTRAILEQQNLLGWETAHLTSTKHTAESPDDETVDGLRFYRTRSSHELLAKVPLLNQMDVVLSLNRRLDHVIAAEKPDILHAHSPSLNGIAALMAGKRHGIPVVYECRAFWEDAAVDHGTSSEGGIRYRLTRALESYVFRRADAVTTICEGLKNDIISRDVQENKVKVIPNAVDIERFSIETTRDNNLIAELGLVDKTVLGFIGSFYAYEGLGLLIRSLPLILSEVPNAKVLLVGGGPQQQELSDLVAQMGLGDSVVFTGRVSHEVVKNYYHLVDIFVYPRLSMRLTDLVTPLKPLEAMAQGKLVLASDVGGHKELIQDGYNGHLFKAGEENSLAQAVVDLEKQKDSWEALKANGRSFVEQERNWYASVSRYNEVYSKLIS